VVKKRVHELAKELDIESKDLINRASGLGIDAKSHMSTLEDDEVTRIRGAYQPRPGNGPSETAEPAPPRQEAPKAAPADAGLPRAPRGSNLFMPDHAESGAVKVPSRPPDRRFSERSVRPPGMVNQMPRTQQAGPELPKQVPFQAPPVQSADSAPVQRPVPPRQEEPGAQQPVQRQSDSRPPQGDRRPPGEAGRPAPGYQRQDGPRPGMAPRPQGDRPGYGRGPGEGYRPPGGAPRPDSRPGTSGPRPDFRPAGQGPRPDFRPAGQGPRPDFRPAGQGPRPDFRPAGQGPRPDFRPAGQGPRPDFRPAGQGPRPDFRPAGQGPRPDFRPAGQGPRPGQGPGPRPDFRPGGFGPRPGQGPPRPGQGGGPRPIPAIPKPPEPAKGTEKPKAPGKGQARPQSRDRYGDRRGAADEKQILNKIRTRGPQGAKRGPVREQRVVPMVEKKPVVIGESVTVQELAEKMKKSPAELIKRLLGMGLMATINQEIDSDTAILLAGEFGYEVEVKITPDQETLLMQEPEEDPANLVHRPAVVTVMGHVDHGKTSLLDAIRKTNVTAGEAGGITQHIGAYQVEINNKRITFLDTPGHEAFTAMRARGAQVTDVVVLVVAADDGVMPQTLESIHQAREAKVPIVVALNKIDKPGAEVDRIKQQLTEQGLVAEEWGGDTIFAPVSALKGTGVESLLEMILLVADMAELSANPSRPARGTVIEAELDRGRGPVATVLVQNGTLQVGDVLVAGAAFGKVRAMIDDKGRRVKKAGPSTPVAVLGFSEVPQAGDLFLVAPDEKVARSIAQRRGTRKRQEEMKGSARVSLDDLFKQIKEGQVKDLRIVIKGDVQGSIEALKQSLERLSNDEVKVNVILSGVGAITETDIMTASVSNAIVMGFNVRPDVNARRAADQEKVDVRLYRVIYEAINDVQAAILGMLEPEVREVVLGRVEVRKIYKVSKVGTIAGCYVIEGKIIRDAGVRLIRDGVVVFEGKLDSLKRFKDDAKEVAQGYECGIALERYNEIQEGDIIEAFTTESIKRELPNASASS